MADPQQGDVFLFQQQDDGDIAVAEGIIEMRGSLETAAYLSLFGGNQDDSGDEGSSQNWWGNLIENEPSKQYRSRTQHILRAGEIDTSQLRAIEEAVRLDLKWFLDDSIVTELTVTVTIPELNTVSIEIILNVFGEETTITFVQVWRRDIEAHQEIESGKDARTFAFFGIVSGPGAFQIQPVITTTLDP